MNGNGDKRLHARTQAADMADRWEATFGRATMADSLRRVQQNHEEWEREHPEQVLWERTRGREGRSPFAPPLDAPPETP